MRVPVLLSVPALDNYRQAVAAAIVQPGTAMNLAAASRFPGVELDEQFVPAPLGGPVGGQAGSSAAMNLEAFTVETAPRFVLRGHVETETLDNLPTEAGDAIIYSDPLIVPLMTCGGTLPVGNGATVAAKLNLAPLHGRGLDGRNVAIAIVDTGINLAFLTAKLASAPALDAAASWFPPAAPNGPGLWPVAHGSMCAYDVLIAAPAATLIDVPVLGANYPGGGSSMSGTLSAAVAAFSYLMQSRAAGALAHYQAVVANNSWGIFHPSWDFPANHPGRYCDNPNHPFNIQVAAAIAAGIDVLFAAGNCGAPCADGRCQGRTQGTIMGASAVQDVLTIAGCDTNDVRVGYSSQGPSIPNMYPQKPDVTSYTHFLGSEAFGAGSPDSGTSAACPVTSGGVAALRSSPRGASATLSPAALFAGLRANARQVQGPAGWNGDYGFGIVDLISTARALNL